ncbi:GNAT family N-acetyltransferase [Pyruvatibacter mobilis]|uniref:GNAT family N-acetyltransferase n=1 Tax=Pyruvatibacter mobilis TaxID=1712261 RepID=UPI003BACD784
MALLRHRSAGDDAYALEGDGVTLRLPRQGDYAEWAELRARSRAFLTPWEPTWPADDLTRTAFRRRLRRYGRDVRDDAAYPFFVFSSRTGRLVGGCTLSNIRRGVAQTCSLGYWVGDPYKQQGFTGAAVRTLIPFVFDQLKLHRLEAACLPSNEPSARLLLACGFTREGYARNYLRIDGAWRDHLLFAILSTDPRP